MHVRKSEKHASSAPLVLNFNTGNITAQWNMVFDDWFSKAATNVNDMPHFHADEWSKMHGTSTHSSQPDNKVKEPDQKPVQPITRDIKDDSIDKEEAL